MSVGQSQSTAKSSQLFDRTCAFALRIIRLIDSLPSRLSARTIGNQLLKCGTSVGANYRAARRARSPLEFRAKLGIVEEEADEAVYWLELLALSGLVKPKRLENLTREANELLAMVVASIRTSRGNDRRVK
jgi:four helix bundle protein